MSEWYRHGLDETAVVPRESLGCSVSVNVTNERVEGRMHPMPALQNRARRYLLWQSGCRKQFGKVGRSARREDLWHAHDTIVAWHRFLGDRRCLLLNSYPTVWFLRRRMILSLDGMATVVASVSSADAATDGGEMTRRVHKIIVLLRWLVYRAVYYAKGAPRYLSSSQYRIMLGTIIQYKK